MLKSFIVFLFALVLAAPALAKPRNVYPVSCDDLWAAVKATLGDQGNYGVLSMNDAAHHASFVVVGGLTQYTDKVALTGKDGGCAMDANLLQVGSGSEDYLQFHHRVLKSLAKLQAAEPRPAPAAGGQH